jgi:hypothetical protein
MTEADVAAIVEGIAPVTWDAITRAIAPLVQRQTVLETQVAQLVEAAKDYGAIRERVAVIETRPIQPGPPGQDGAPGPPGHDGKDGADGSPGLEFCGVFLEGQTYDRPARDVRRLKLALQRADDDAPGRWREGLDPDG